MGTNGGGRTLLWALRRVYAAFVGELILVGFVGRMTLAGAKPGSDTAVVALTAAVGVGCLAFVLRVHRQPLGGAPTNDALAALYRVRFFICLTLAQAPGLMGFAAMYVTGRWLLFLVGAAFSFVGLAVIAPTSAALRRADDRLAAEGSATSLTEALGAPAPARRSR